MNQPNPEAEFRAFLAENRFMIQRSRSSGRHVFYPRIAEPGTGARDLEWVEASGAGTVHSFTVVTQRGDAPDYNIALVDLAEGPRLMTRLVGPGADTPGIGQAVRAEIETPEGGDPLLVFRLVAEGEAEQ
ncbi:Zn-ribbon domain-containing OB-fold protein [Pseudooceanicola pacificus]|nr:OB-fold domain-containing protein [Pseudooceanicola pacificus]